MSRTYHHGRSLFDYDNGYVRPWYYDNPPKRWRKPRDRMVRHRENQLVSMWLFDRLINKRHRNHRWDYW